MLTIRAMTGGAGYAQRHLEHSDYYDEQHRVRGEWHGRGAELLGLKGEVTRDQFEAVRQGLHPETENSCALVTAQTGRQLTGTSKAKHARFTI